MGWGGFFYSQSHFTQAYTGGDFCKCSCSQRNMSRNLQEHLVTCRKRRDSCEDSYGHAYNTELGTDLRQYMQPYFSVTATERAVREECIIFRSRQVTEFENPDIARITSTWCESAEAWFRTSGPLSRLHHIAACP
jgi:hypothetical protein